MRWNREKRGIAAGNTRAVSYTHLDVYKRQIVGDLYKVIPEIIAEWDNAEALYDATTK